MTPERKRLMKQCDDLAREIVYKRDNYTCQYCGSKTRQLNPAHFITRTNKALRWDTGNIVTLCSMPCHRNWAHGYPDEFTEWFKARIGEQAFEILQLRKHNKLSTTASNLRLVKIMLEQELEELCQKE